LIYVAQADGMRLTESDASTQLDGQNRNTRDLRSSGMLRSADWYLLADVLGQSISPIFKGQVVLVQK
jgi:hypothetical protein